MTALRGVTVDTRSWFSLQSAWLQSYPTSIGGWVGGWSVVLPSTLPLGNVTDVDTFSR